MDGLFKHLAAILVHFGIGGLLIVGVLDSSFLFMPLGNDLLVVALAAKAHSLAKAGLYAAAAAAGSVAGCAILDYAGRKGGKAGLDKHVSRKRLEYVEKKLKNRAAVGLAVAALMPPPFPFTPFVAAAAAIQYPRGKLLGVIAAARITRFLIEASLATYFGRRIIRIAAAPALRWTIAGLIAVSLIGSAISIYGWFRRSKTVQAF